MMRYLMFRVGLPLGALGTIATVAAVDRAVNYQRIPARVTELSATCYLEKYSGKTREWTESRECPEIEGALASDPQYQRFTLKRDTTAEVDYYSPVDRQIHHGKVVDHTSGNTAPFGGVA